jgi:hypothetical protein
MHPVVKFMIKGDCRLLERVLTLDGWNAAFLGWE